MTLKSHAKFEEKLTYGLENDMGNLENFGKIGTSMESFGPKQKIHQLKTYGGVVCNYTEVS